MMFWSDHQQVDSLWSISRKSSVAVPPPRADDARRRWRTANRLNAKMNQNQKHLLPSSFNTYQEFVVVWFAALEDSGAKLY